MRKSKQQIMNMQAQLEHIGLRLESFSKLAFNNTRVDTIGTEFIDALKDLDAQQNCNRYVWNGLPDYMFSWLIEYMLYIKGSLVGYVSGGILYILPYAQAKGVNLYGMPNAVTPVSFNGVITDRPLAKELPVNNFGDPNANAKACILYDRSPVWVSGASPVSRAILNDELVRYQAEILGRIKNNLKNLDKKVVFYVEDDKQKRQMEQDIREAYGTDDPFIVVVKGTSAFGTGDKGQTLQGDIANETQSLFETWQSVNSIRCMCSGIENNGAFEKKERKITSEMSGDVVQTDLVIDAGLRMRRLFLKQMQTIYPEYEWLKNITVEINERTIEYDEVDTDESTSDETIESESNE